jgi:hypothetical protein
MRNSGNYPTVGVGDSMTVLSYTHLEVTENDGIYELSHSRALLLTDETRLVGPKAW